MDMVRPAVHPGLAAHHNLQITISGGNEVAERRDRSAKQYTDQNGMMQVLSSTASPLSPGSSSSTPSRDSGASRA